MTRKLIAEFVGTFWLVFCGCGSAVLAAAFPGTGIGFLGVALAFGLTVLTMAYAVGAISGGHFNPAVTVGLTAARRFSGTLVVPYIISQVLGAIVAAGVLYLVASGNSSYSLSSGLAANGYGVHSPGGYSLGSCLLAEIILTAGFVFVIVAVTSQRSLDGFAPIAIGLALTLVHLLDIPITNASVNPARSTGPAIIMGGWALSQLWLFWLAPIIGGLVGGGLAVLLGVQGSVRGAPAETIVDVRKEPPVGPRAANY